MSSLKTPEFSIKLRSDKLLKNIFKTYKEFADTCDLFFTPERLIIKSITPGRDAYLFTVIWKDDCLEYFSKKSQSFEIDLGIFNKVLGRLGAQDSLVLSSHSDEQILMLLKRFNKERKFYIAYKETDETPEELEESLLNLNKHTEKGIHFNIPIPEFSTIIKDALVTSETIYIFYENSHIRFSNDEEEINNYEYIFQKEIDYEELEDQLVSKYGLELFDKYCKNTINSQFFCAIPVKGPAKITQKFFHDSHFSIFIAPRLDDEEEEEESVEIQSNREQAIEEVN